MMYKTLFYLLNTHQVSYLVVGGIAVNLHGYIRATMDLDLIIHLEATNIQKFINAVSEGGLQPAIPVELSDLVDQQKREEWISQKNLIAFPLRNITQSGEQLDLILVHPLDFNAAYKNKKTVLIDKIPIHLMAIPDLIQMKSASARKRDQIDLEALHEIQRIQNDTHEKKQLDC